MVTENYAIYQNSKKTSLENKEVELVESVQMNIYQSNTYRKDLSWLHFNNEPRVQDRQQVKDQHPFISVFVAYPTIPRGNQEHQPRHNNSIPHMAIWQIYRDTEQPQEKKTSQNESRLQFPGGTFSNRDNVRAPIQVRRESQPQHLKR